MCAGSEPEMDDITDTPPTLLDGGTVHAWRVVCDR